MAPSPTNKHATGCKSPCDCLCGVASLLVWLAMDLAALHDIYLDLKMAPVDAI